MKCPERPHLTHNDEHEWVAPSWLRQHFDGRVDLQLVCKHCGIIAGISDVTPDTVKSLKSLFGLIINNAEFIKLERWNGGV